MNYKLIIKTVSILLIIVSIFMIIPGIMAIYFEEYDAVNGFSITIIAAISISSLFIWAFRNPDSDVMTTRDGFLFVTLSWIMATITGSLPLYLSGAMPSFTDAFFETISGFTTTGASILTDIESLPNSILFWRSLTHWLGGMGIVVLTVAILPLLGIGGLQLIKAEAPGPTVDKITPRVAETAKILWYIYLLFTVTETTLLMIGGMGITIILTNSALHTVKSTVIPAEISAD